MELDAFGQEQLCTQGMQIDSFSLNFLLKDGQKVKWMVNFLLGEENFLKLYQLFEKVYQLMNNGKMLNFWYLMPLD